MFQDTLKSKTKLKFDPSKLSTNILKKYLTNMFDSQNEITEYENTRVLLGSHLMENIIEKLSNLDEFVTDNYINNPIDTTNYKILIQLSLMSLKEWKQIITQNNIEYLYINDDSILQDSKYYFNSWKIVDDEVGSHDSIMNFYRILSDIISELSKRCVVELSLDGQIVEQQSSYTTTINSLNNPTNTPPNTPNLTINSLNNLNSLNNSLNNLNLQKEKKHQFPPLNSTKIDQPKAVESREALESPILSLKEEIQMENLLDSHINFVSPELDHFDTTFNYN